MGIDFLDFFVRLKPVLRQTIDEIAAAGRVWRHFSWPLFGLCSFLRDTDKTDYGLLCGTYDGRMIVQIGIISLIEARFCYWQSASAVGNPTTRLSPQWRQLSIPVDFHRSWEGKVRSLILCHIQDHTVRSYNLLDLALRSGSTP